MQGQHEDVARFAPDERSEVVAASFTCPYCLGEPEAVTVSDFAELPVATCTCAECAEGWLVYLDTMQALRLSLAPPLELPPVAWRPPRVHPGLLGPGDADALGG